MSVDYVLVLAPERRFIECGGWPRFPQGMPKRSQAEVVELLSSVPVLQYDGATFWGDDLEEFELDEPDVFDILFVVHGGESGAHLEISAVCLALAEKLGSLTLFNAGTDQRIQIDAGMDGEAILGFFG